MTNPFEDEDGTYLALVNDEGQYSLWPAFVEVPAGWTVARPEGNRQETLDFISEQWTDLRPASLIRQMAAAQADAGPPADRGSEQATDGHGHTPGRDQDDVHAKAGP